LEVDDHHSIEDIGISGERNQGGSGRKKGHHRMGKLRCLWMKPWPEWCWICRDGHICIMRCKFLRKK
jgi:hypothetical protein